MSVLCAECGGHMEVVEFCLQCCPPQDESTPPTEPRADDPAALVAEAQRQHHPDCAVFDHPDDCDLEGHEGEQLMCSNDCCLNWPCLTARLADALETAIGYGINRAADLRLELDAARADLAASRDAYRRAVAQEELWQDACTQAQAEAAALRRCLESIASAGHDGEDNPWQVVANLQEAAEAALHPPEEPAQTCPNCRHARHDGFCPADECHCIGGYITRETA